MPSMSGPTHGLNLGSKAEVQTIGPPTDPNLIPTTSIRRKKRKRRRKSLSQTRPARPRARRLIVAATLPGV